jgi:hypothetical protein
LREVMILPPDGERDACDKGYVLHRSFTPIFVSNPTMEYSLQPVHSGI